MILLLQMCTSESLGFLSTVEILGLRINRLIDLSGGHQWVLTQETDPTLYSDCALLWTQRLEDGLNQL